MSVDPVDRPLWGAMFSLPKPLYTRPSFTPALSVGKLVTDSNVSPSPSCWVQNYTMKHGKQQGKKEETVKKTNKSKAWRLCDPRQLPT